MPTTKDGVMIAAPRAATMDQIKPVFDRLATCIETSDTKGALKAIRQLVPEFQSGLTEKQRGTSRNSLFLGVVSFFLVPQSWVCYIP